MPDLHPPPLGPPFTPLRARAEPNLPVHLQQHAAPATLSRCVSAFVHRDDPQGGGVMRLLPDARPSIQIMLADRYWLRDQDSPSDWEPVAPVSLWGPRYRWCYGFAERHIRVFALGLTASGLQALTGQATQHWLNTVRPLAQVNARLSQQLLPSPDEPFGDWMRRAEQALGGVFLNDQGRAEPLAAALNVLATADGDAVCRAAEAEGLSERQFRRVFQQLYGVTPKTYQRALRVDRMLRQLHAQPWETDLYADQPIPFADQPHSIREFRALTGITPSDYLRAKRRADLTLRSVPVQGLPGPEQTSVSAE